MTGKKSKVKALALAVMCAILAGGYSGFNPVYAQDGTYDNLTVTGNITVSGDTSTTESDKKAGFTVGTKKNGSSKFYTEANLTGGYGGDITYSITLKADNYGGIEVKGKDGNTENYNMAKLGTNGIIYSTKGLILGSNGNDYAAAANAKFYVDGDNGNITSKGTLSVAGGKFSVGTNGTISAVGGNFTVDENKIKLGYLTINVTNDGVTFTDTNRKDTHHITISEMVDASYKTKGMSRYLENDRHDTPRKVTSIESQVKIRDDGRVIIGPNNTQSVLIDGGYGILVGHQGKVISEKDGDVYLPDQTAGLSNVGVFAGGNQFANAKAGMSNEDGSLKAASGKFTVDKDGKLISANGSKIGGVTIDGESLSNGTKSINVSDLAADHTLVTDATKGNENLYKGLSSVQTLANSLDTRTAGISRDTTGTAKKTTIEGKLQVGSDGTVKINEGADQQVIIDSNGIKVGKNSSRMNDSYGFATTKDLYVGADSADNPKAAESKFYVNGSNGNVITSGSVTLNSGTNSTQLSAGGVSFTKDGTTTTIEGDKVTVGSKSFKLSDIADVGNRIDNVNSRVDGVQQDVKNLNDAISKETAERQQDVKNLNDAISKETAERQQDVKNLNDAISKETAERQQDVKNLNDAISKETEERQQDVKNLNDAINKETAERKDEVKRLDGKVDDVQKNVDDVKSSVAKINTDFSQVSGRIDNVETSIDDVKTSVKTVSDSLGQLDALDAEDVKAHEKYSSNQSVVGAINAEAAIRSEAVTRLDTAIANEAAARQADVARLDSRVSDVSNRLNKVGAMAAAIAALKTMGYDPEAPTEISIGLGQYKGETGVALGFFHYPNKNFMLNLSVSTAGGETMGSVGATWHFGKKAQKHSAEEQDKN